MTLAEIGFTDKGIYKIDLDARDWVLWGRAVRYKGTTLTAKAEAHITAVNKDLGAELEELVTDCPEAQARIEQALRDAGWPRKDAGWSWEGGFARGRLYHVAKEKRREDEQGNPFTQHAESIVQRVRVPGIEAVYACLSEIVGRALEVPPTHVTLYVLGDPRGISLQTERAFGCYAQGEVSPEELVRIE
jgi:hypothetical protein